MKQEDNQSGPDGNMSGLPYALGAYILWGFMPIFFKLVQQVPPLEVLAQRVIWSLPLCLIIMAFRKQMAEFFGVFRDWRLLRMLLISSLLIAVNWLTYIFAVFNEHVLAASLGYYLNPLINVLLGMLVLGERLTKTQLVAVVIAAVGVAILMAGALDTLWISLTLALSFGVYGLVRKVTPVASLPGLAVETTILAPAAAMVGFYYLQNGDGVGFGSGLNINLLLMLSGVVTAVPLLLFATAARRMSYAVLGVVQYLAPSIIFLMGIFVFHEALKPAQILCFLLIWVSVAIFMFDLWKRSRASA